jgi:uncharacterized protein YabE (DUF348 family)/3D (Asp-Asp-Asp) domain-containing protein
MPARALARWQIRALPSSIDRVPSFASHIAFLLALALIAAIAFLLFPARRVSVVADGTERTVLSHQKSDAAVVRQAGLALSPGDTLVWQETPDGRPVLAVQRATPVIAEVDGRLVYWRTRADTVDEALAEIGVTSGDGDSLFINDLRVAPWESLTRNPALMVSSVRGLVGALKAEPLALQQPLTITMRRAVPFTVVEDGHSLDLRSSALSLSAALRESGIILRPGDLVLPDVEAPLAAGLSVYVYHADKVNVFLPEGDTVIYSRASTVEDALAEAGMPLGERDRVEPSRDASLEDGMDVYVFRVDLGKAVEDEEIPFKTVAQADPDLDWGTTRRADGQEGVLRREYDVTYENGVEVGRTFSREWVEREPVDAVVYYSGQDGVSAAGIPDGLQVVQVMHVYATWYNPASSGKSPSSSGYGMTATGVPVTKGIVAVDPSVLPYGTRMYVPGYGVGEAADCGGAVKGNIIDLGYPDGVTPNWSSRWIDIYILGP